MLYGSLAKNVDWESASVIWLNPVVGISGFMGAKYVPPLPSVKSTLFTDGTVLSGFLRSSSSVKNQSTSKVRLLAAILGSS